VEELSNFTYMARTQR